MPPSRPPRASRAARLGAAYLALALAASACATGVRALDEEGAPFADAAPRDDASEPASDANGDAHDAQGPDASDAGDADASAPDADAGDADASAPDADASVPDADASAPDADAGDADAADADAGTCTKNADCPAGRICDKTAHACVAGCAPLHGCPSGQDCCGGLCFDLKSDPAHCGACDESCAGVPHATAACSAGACAIASCDVGYADCNLKPGDGCEVSLATDVGHCGTCATVCPSGGGTPSCNGGTCSVTPCPAGFGNCDGVASNGCEQPIHDDPAHCGGCGVACAVEHGTPSCTGTTCGIASCANGWADCDTDPANGCETDTRTAASCGGCGVACSPPHATGTCPAGTCAVGACADGWGDCDGSGANGCETDVLTDGAHCGACGHACAAENAGAFCKQGACAIAECALGWVDCDGAFANGCEADLLNDRDNCGACGSACPTGAHAASICAGASCSLACDGGFGDCDGDPANGCESPLDSASNCGGCGVACGASETCVNGACSDTCTNAAASFTFEAGAQGFTHAPTDGISADDPWAVGTPTGVTCHGGSKCWATNLTGNYKGCQTAQLVSPTFDLRGCAGSARTVTLSFWHFYEFEVFSSGTWWDGGLLQVSTNGGQTWSDVTPSPGYQGTFTGSFSSCSPKPDIAGHAGWSGVIPGGAWVKVSVDVAAAQRVQSLRYRWLFGADANGVDLGWYIDDVAITVQ